MTVQRIVVWYKLGLMPEEIVERIGHLSLAQVYAALAYYHADREAVESEIAAEDAEYPKGLCGMTIGLILRELMYNTLPFGPTIATR